MSNKLKHYIIDPASNFGKLDSTYQLINFAKRREERRDLELLKQVKRFAGFYQIMTLELPFDFRTVNY